MNVSYNLKRINYEERVYCNIYPYLRMAQASLWITIFSIFTGLVFWVYYLTNLKQLNVDFLQSLGLDLFFTVICLAIAIWGLYLVYRMNIWLGLFTMITIAPFLAFTAFLVLVGIAKGMVQENWGLQQAIFLIFFITIGLLMVYVFWEMFLGGIRLTFCKHETKRIVAEIGRQHRSFMGVISKLIGMPFSVSYIVKNKLRALSLFIWANFAFALFIIFSFMAYISPLHTLLFNLDTWKIKLIPNTPAWAWGAFIYLKYSFFINAGLAGLALIIGAKMRAWARNRTILSILESQKYDSRPLVLFLRPFYDDQVTLMAPRLSLLGRLFNILQKKQNLDVLLLEEGTTYGPVVAIGSPSDPVPPYGAARGYFSDNDWRSGVKKLANDSLHIVICLDTTEGVLWELEHIIKQGHTQKTLYLLHPSAKKHAENKAIRSIVIGKINSASRSSLNLCELLEFEEPVLGFFFTENGCVMAGVSSEFSEASYLLMLRWFFRTVNSSV